MLDKREVRTREVRFARVMHEEVDLLNSVDEIRTSQSQVMESAGETPVLRRIRDQRVAVS